MEWRPDEMDRLHELHLEYVEKLRADIIQMNVALGSSRPAPTNLKVMSRAEFEGLLTEPNREPDLIRCFVMSLIRGYEHEFPTLDAA